MSTSTATVWAATFWDDNDARNYGARSFDTRREANEYADNFRRVDPINRHTNVFPFDIPVHIDPEEV